MIYPHDCCRLSFRAGRTCSQATISLTPRLRKNWRHVSLKNRTLYMAEYSCSCEPLWFAGSPWHFINYTLLSMISASGSSCYLLYTYIRFKHRVWFLQTFYFWHRLSGYLKTTFSWFSHGRCVTSYRKRGIQPVLETDFSTRYRFLSLWKRYSIVKWYFVANIIRSVQ